MTAKCFIPGNACAHAAHTIHSLQSVMHDSYLLYHADYSVIMVNSSLLFSVINHVACCDKLASAR